MLKRFPRPKMKPGKEQLKDDWERLLFTLLGTGSSWKSLGIPWPGSLFWHTLPAALSTEGETGWWLVLSDQKLGLSGAGVPFLIVVVLCMYHQLYRQIHPLRVDISLHIFWERYRIFRSKVLEPMDLLPMSFIRALQTTLHLSFNLNLTEWHRYMKTLGSCFQSKNLST